MTTLATDDFNRANNASLGANWSTQSGAGSMAILSNQCNVPSDAGNYYSAVTWPNDQWSQATILTTANMLHGGVRIRCASGAATYYNGGCNPTDSGNKNRRIWKTVAGVRTSLGSQATDVVANDVLYLEAQGTSLVLKVNGTTVVSVTDSSIASGNAGLGGRNFASDSPKFDDWSGGDFGGGTTTVNVDCGMPADWYGSVASDHGMPTQLLGQLFSDHAASIDWRLQVAADHSFPTNWLGPIAADSVIPVEWRGAIQVNADQSLPADWRNAMASDKAMPIAISGVIAIDNNLPADLRAGVASNQSVLTAWLTAVIADGALPTDWRGGTLVSSDQTMPLTWLTGKSIDPQLVADWRSAMASDQALPVATLLVLNASSLSAIEWRAGVNDDSIIRTDWRTGLITDSALPFEYGGTQGFFYGNVDVFHIDERGAVWHIEARATVWHAKGRKH